MLLSCHLLLFTFSKSLFAFAVMVEPDREDVTRKSGLIYAAALSLVLSVAVLLGVGWALDRWLHTSPWFVVAGIILGSVIGFYQFLRLISKVT